jgi:hypothetical protein
MTCYNITIPPWIAAGQFLVEKAGLSKVYTNSKQHTISSSQARPGGDVVVFHCPNHAPEVLYVIKSVAKLPRIHLDCLNLVSELLYSGTSNPSAK